MRLSVDVTAAGYGGSTDASPIIRYPVPALEGYGLGKGLELAVVLGVAKYDLFTHLDRLKFSEWEQDRRRTV